MIKLPDSVKYILDKLESAGFEGYAVGGCVRDSLLGKIPADWDVAANAKPQEVMEVFAGRRVIPTGLQHGTVTLQLKGVSYEITMYRADGEYTDGRRPDAVTFTDDIVKDLSRRDFTINAMAYSDKRGLVDCFDGVSDLKNGFIRCVGKASDRFAEDYLRMLRAYRFAAVLGFKLDSDIISAVCANKWKINGISAERIRAELNMILLSDNFSGITDFMDVFGCIILPEVYRLKEIPQINSYHFLDVYGHTMEVLRHSENNLVMRLCALLHDTGKADALSYGADGVTHFYEHAQKSAVIAQNILKRLKYDNDTISHVTELIREHNFGEELDRKGVKLLVSRLGAETVRALFVFARADAMGKTEAAKEKKLPALERDSELLDDIINSAEPCALGDLAVNGRDVQEVLGIKAGKAVGDALSFLLGKVIDNPSVNSRESLLELLREYDL